MPNPVVHWEIVSADKGKELQQFYADLFGWEVKSDNPFDYGTVDTHAGGINGGIGPTTGPTRVTIYAEVDDLQTYLDRAVGLGASVLLEPHEVIPGRVTLALFADPAGNVTGLLKSKSTTQET
jgi:predicted enzyme related to lactoylglutathione lyase